MVGGYVSSAVLAASGAAGIVIPNQIAPVLDTILSTSRAKTEFRVAYACFAAIGTWALIAGDSAVFKAIGVLWLGAAGVRIASLALDRPRTDRTYWSYLALEVAVGLAGVLGSR